MIKSNKICDFFWFQVLRYLGHDRFLPEERHEDLASYFLDAAEMLTAEDSDEESDEGTDSDDSDDTDEDNE